MSYAFFKKGKGTFDNTNRVAESDIFIPVDSTVEPSTPAGTSSYSSVWVGGLTFDVKADSFPIDGVYYSAQPRTVTLDDADPSLDRIDLIGVASPLTQDGSWTIKVIKGQPSANPTAFNYDPSLFFPIDFVLVQAASSGPEGFVKQIVFDSNTGKPTEWNFTGDASSNVSVEPTYMVNNTVGDPVAETVINVSRVDSNDILKFDNIDQIPISSLSSFSFDILLSVPYSGNIEVTFSELDESLSGNSYTVTVTPGSYGFNGSLINQWQTISFNPYVEGSGSIDFSSIWVRLSQTGLTPSSTAFHVALIDKVEIVTGGNVTAPPPNGKYTHPNHTGEVTSISDGATTVQSTAITNKASSDVTPTDQFLMERSGVLYRVTARDIVDAGNLQKIVTTPYTITNDDNNYTIFFDSPTPIDVQIPVLDDNFECNFYNIGAGDVTFSADGVNVIGVEGSVLQQHKVAALLKKLNNNDYRLKGELSGTAI